ncbi:TlpA family protein disulfide reductase [Parapedobacter sp. ISTM3]|uniref:TlpA family protein disulfide reductase n=1 Tax=Parapedobacter sp. ISTM3 TaxID=2800130 RepID=UPI00190485C6|nr:TlpA disulfide reductase family protein [Parapedobacter sp. ISTM3]MBK1439689.1 TlpA family protein disulfide reductase [Parapedobacter sp. ISTM3]
MPFDRNRLRACLETYGDHSATLGEPHSRRVSANKNEQTFFELRGKVDEGLEWKECSRRNPEESCVCTLAKAPARYGLGLALGMAVLLWSAGLCLQVRGQAPGTKPGPATAVADIKPLQIGDTIPESLWHLPLQVVNHPEGKDTTTLNDYRGKLIILDFWATWCSACLKAFPKLDSLRQSIPELEVIRVTEEHIKPSAISWPSVVKDSLLATYFPHRLIPHYVWINPGGSVYAFTSTDQLTAANIYAALADVEVDMAQKRDLDVSKPLFLADDFQMQGLQYYAVLHRGRYYGIGSESLYRRTDGVLTGRALTNRSLYSLFTSAARPLLEQAGQTYTSNRVVLDVRDSAGLVIDSDKPGHVDDTYSYDINVLPERAGALYRLMLDDLNRHTDFHGSIEDRTMDCLVLRRTGIVDRLATKGARPEGQLKVGAPIRLTNRPLKALVVFLNAFDQLHHVVLDETGYAAPVDIELPALVSVETLNEHLGRYGLVLEKARRTIPMFIIRDHSPNH